MGVPAKPLVPDTAGCLSRARSCWNVWQRALDESSRQVPQPDAFSYELTVETAQGRRVIAFDDANASDALKQLTKELRA